MFFSKKSKPAPLPINWPSPFHNKCDQPNCKYPNPPQPAEGMYDCTGVPSGFYCEGHYYVSATMAQAATKYWQEYYRLEAEVKRREQEEREREERERMLRKDNGRYLQEVRRHAQRERTAALPLARRDALTQRSKGAGLILDPRMLQGCAQPQPDPRVMERQAQPQPDPRIIERQVQPQCDPRLRERETRPRPEERAEHERFDPNKMVRQRPRAPEESREQERFDPNRMVRQRPRAPEESREQERFDPNKMARQRPRAPDQYPPHPGWF